MFWKMGRELRPMVDMEEMTQGMRLLQQAFATWRMPRSSAFNKFFKIDTVQEFGECLSEHLHKCQALNANEGGVAPCHDPIVGCKPKIAKVTKVHQLKHPKKCLRGFHRGPVEIASPTPQLQVSHTSSELPLGCALDPARVWRAARGHCDCLCTCQLSQPVL